MGRKGPPGSARVQPWSTCTVVQRDIQLNFVPTCIYNTVHGRCVHVGSSIGRLKKNKLSETYVHVVFGAGRHSKFEIAPNLSI